MADAASTSEATPAVAATPSSSLRINTTALAKPAKAAAVTSPRNEFFVSQRAADYELSKLDTLSIEEQEVLANIQELQLQLMQLRAEEDEDSDDEAAPSRAAATAAASSQLIVVSNNLPVVLERVPQTGRWKATKTTGGLDKLMCLTGVRNDLNFLWVGWVGQHIPKHEHESVRRLLLQHNCLPVFLSNDVATRHNGFSSDVLWSHFHYVSEPEALSAQPGAHNNASKRFNKQDWRAYESANESFADAIAEIYNEGDNVWVHDYHLMLLPSLLRQRIPLCHIGWFLHTPFPSSDVYTRLPVRAQLLTGVLQADLVGFQTFDYERHFLSTCQRLLGVDCSHQGIRSQLAGDRDHFTAVGVFPIGISIEPFARAASSAATLRRVSDLHSKFGSKRIILGIDRLDNIKGIPHKLLAMEALLSRFPEWQHNVVLIQIGISSRSGVVGSASATAEAAATPKNNAPTAETANATNPTSKPQATEPLDAMHQLEMSSASSKALLSHVNSLVGRINGTYGSLDYTPIHFIHQRETVHEELCALYDLADVCLVTSTRDGMNLVSHEFVVCQQHFMRRKDERTTAARSASPSTASSFRPLEVSSSDAALQLSPTQLVPDWEGEAGGPGVLVLSEFAGCAQSLNGALMINPWNTDDVALSVHHALSMCRAERELRQQKLYRYVSSNTATSWSMQFLGDLSDAVQTNRGKCAQLPKLDTPAIVQAYKATHNRVIILDYDRTLTPQHSLLPLAAVGPNFKSLLDTLSADPANTVFIVSARERKFLETWLQGVRVGVAAEDGFFYRMNLRNDREQWKTMSKFHYDAAAASASARTVPNPTNPTDTSSYLSASSDGGLSTHRRSSRSNSITNAFSGFPPPSSNGGPLSSTDSFDGVDTEADTSWKDLVLPVLVAFTDRTPGSYIEDKESSLTWYFDDADPHFGGWQAKDLQITLERQLLGTALAVSQGHKWVSVEHDGCTKTKVLESILKHLSLPQQIALKQQHAVDFVLCVCDDVTDDQMFQTLETLAAESTERHAAAAVTQRKRKSSMNGPNAAGLVRSTSTSSSDARRLSTSTSLNDKDDSVDGATTSGVAFERRSAAIDDDNKVAFSRLHNVPVRLSPDVQIFTVVVGQDVQHSSTRSGSGSKSSSHAGACSVESLSDVRKVLKEFADASRKAGAIASSSTNSLLGNTATDVRSLTDAESAALLESLVVDATSVDTDLKAKTAV